MRRNILSKLLTAVFLLTLFSCKVRKEVIQPAKPSPVSQSKVIDEKTTILNNIIAKQADFNTLSLKAKANLNIDNQDNDVTLNIRIRKDKAIWVSVTAIAGLEVARALVTPDSIKVLNRLEGIYMRKPFNYIYGFTNKQLNFNTLQAIFAGNAMPEFLNKNSIQNTSGTTAALSGTVGDLMYALLFNESFKVTRTDLKDDKAKQRLVADYSDFTTVSGKLMPQSINIKSDVSNKNISLGLKYTRIEIDVPVETPFTVPARFKVEE